MEITGALELLGLKGRGNDAQCVVSNFSELKIVLVKSKRKASVEEQLRIKNIWEKHLEDYPDDFDRYLVSLKEIFKRDGVVNLRVRQTNFSEFFATRDGHNCKRLVFSSQSLDYDYPIPLSFGIVTQTAPTKNDPKGCIIAAIRGKTAFDCGRATFLPGGYIDPRNKKKWPLIGNDTTQKRIVPLNEEIRRELREELPGVVWNNPPKLLGIVHSLIDSCQTLIAGRMDIALTAEEVIARSKIGGEIKEIICVPADIESLREFAQKHTLCIHDVYKIALYLADVM
jgi:hypothetical protein